MNSFFIRTRNFLFTVLGYSFILILGLYITSILGNLFDGVIVNDPFKKGSGNPSIKPITFLIVGVIMAPLVEEIIFRYPLAKLRVVDLLMSVGLYFMFVSFSNSKFILNPCFVNLKINYLIISGFFLISRYFIDHNLTINKKHRLTIVLISSFLFGIGHFITIDKLTSLKFSIYISLLISSFSLILSGIYFSFVRLRFGFLYSLGLHFCINFTGFLFKFIF